RAERIEILAECRDAHVVGVFELRDRTLGDIEPTGKRRLAHRFAVTELVETDLLERFRSRLRDPLGRARTRDDILAKFGELGSRHQINPSSRSSFKYTS